jgi:hypothetical protein
VDGGEFALRAGSTELRVQDLTGWWGRCDALVLAKGDFRPSNDPVVLAKQRLAYEGVSPEVEDAGSFDVVVVGAALSLEGPCTVLVDDVVDVAAQADTGYR